MPLVRIDLREGKPAEYVRAIADGVHRALVETSTVPEKDRFQVITQHRADSMIFDPSYLGIARSDDVVFIQLTMSFGRPLEVKKALYARIAELLSERPGLRREDVFISLIEVAKENWSFGNGVAQYA